MNCNVKKKHSKTLSKALLNFTTSLILGAIEKTFSSGPTYFMHNLQSFSSNFFVRVLYHGFQNTRLHIFVVATLQLNSP